MGFLGLVLALSLEDEEDDEEDDEEELDSWLSAAGAGAGAWGAPAFGGAFGAPPVVPPADPRSPEERFQVQLQVRRAPDLAAFVDTDIWRQQLQDMGFTNAAQNVRALLATGGNVHAAIEYILGGGGL